MSYDVWLFAPTYACISTKLSLYLVNKALSLHNILVFSFHAYRTRQMSMNGGTKNAIPIDLYSFQVKLKTRMVVEEYRCNMFNKQEEFQNKWSMLSDSL